MKPKQDPFVAHILDLLADIPGCRSRRMFGGHGIFCETVMFGLVADGVLFLKVDDLIRKDYEELSCGPFIYKKGEKNVAMSYYQAPECILEDSEDMVVWAQKSIAAAQRSKTKKT